jgi:hypothetical protein
MCICVKTYLKSFLSYLALLTIFKFSSKLPAAYVESSFQCCKTLYLINQSIQRIIKKSIQKKLNNTNSQNTFYYLSM